MINIIATKTQEALKMLDSSFTAAITSSDLLAGEDSSQRHRATLADWQ